MPNLFHWMVKGVGVATDITVLYCTLRGGWHVRMPLPLSPGSGCVWVPVTVPASEQSGWVITKKEEDMQ